MSNMDTKDSDVKCDESVSSSDTNVVESTREDQNQQQKRRGGPYSRGQRRKRRAEVYRLHFVKHKPSVRIAEELKVNKNTIDDDIKYWDIVLVKEWKGQDIQTHIIKQLELMKEQKARLADDLEKNPDQKMEIENLIFRIDDKIAQFLVRIDSKDVAVKDEANKLVCAWAQKHGLDFRSIDPWKLANIPSAKYDSIMKILGEENAK